MEAAAASKEKEQTAQEKEQPTDGKEHEETALGSSDGFEEVEAATAATEEAEAAV